MSLVPHRLADLFPPLSPEEFRELVSDVRAHGQREPVTLYEGKLLDGLSRARACAQAGKRLKRRVFRGTEQAAVAFIISANLRRRHLTEGQRAMIAARLATLGRGRPGKSGTSAGLTQRSAAHALHVSERHVRDAVSLRRHGRPEEVREVERGEASLRAIARAMRAREGPKETGAQRDARQLQHYLRRLPDAANMLGEISRRVAALGKTLEVDLSKCLDVPTQRALHFAADGVGELLKACR